ncbi:Helix-turn-helix domain protein [compost metagenome]
MSVEKIAETRNMSVNTIFGHLADCVTDGSIEAEQLLSKDKLSAVRKALEDNPHKTLTELKEMLGADYSFNDLKIRKAYEARNTHQH